MTRQTRTTSPPRYVDRTVFGTPEHVANVLRSTMDNGRLVAATAPRPVVNMPGAVMLRMRLHQPTPGTVHSPRIVTARTIAAPLPRRWRRRAAVVTAVSVLSLAVLAGVAYLVWLAVQALIAALPLLIGAALALYVLSRFLTRAGVCCPGMHCSGCKH
ncbi:hypothetical protein [Phytohabitans kaempferiae]|uniref:Uncharacterized protein n=1 Tax=Phytohabitans kaempferiae TaxID=1620943 RepID=A0ABV6MHC1_9ACTN